MWSMSISIPRRIISRMPSTPLLVNPSELRWPVEQLGPSPGTKRPYLGTRLSREPKPRHESEYLERGPVVEVAEAGCVRGEGLEVDAFRSTAEAVAHLAVLP